MGAMLGGRGGTMSIALSQIGTWVHCPLVQFQSQRHPAHAVTAASIKLAAQRIEIVLRLTGLSPAPTNRTGLRC
jgi:hypothetical protein